jgi:hypothetical protein
MAMMQLMLEGRHAQRNKKSFVLDSSVCRWCRLKIILKLLYIYMTYKKKLELLFSKVQFSYKAISSMYSSPISSHSSLDDKRSSIF